MGCAGSTPAAPTPPAKKHIEIGVCALSTPPPIDLIATFQKRLTEGGTSDLPVEVLSDAAAANTSFKIKDMEFVMSKTDVESLCTADNAIACDGNGIVACVAAAGTEEAALTQLSALAAAPTLKHAGLLVILFGDTDPTKFDFGGAATKAAGVKRSVFVHCVKEPSDGDNLVEFVFKSVVAKILEDQLKMSGLDKKAMGGW